MSISRFSAFSKKCQFGLAPESRAYSSLIENFKFAISLHSCIFHNLFLYLHVQILFTSGKFLRAQACRKFENFQRVKNKHGTPAHDAELTFFGKRTEPADRHSFKRVFPGKCFGPCCAPPGWRRKLKPFYCSCLDGYFRNVD